MSAINANSAKSGRFARKAKRLWYNSRNWAADPTATLGLLLTIVAAYFILAPVLLMLWDAITVDFADQVRTGLPEGAFTTYYIERALFSRISKYIFWIPLGNTALISLIVICSTLLIGGLLGWLVSRTDLLGRRWFSTALIVPYMVPSWTFALAWMTIFKNRTMGGLPGWFESLGVTPPNWLAYGFLPIAVILSLHYVPFVILLVGNALRQFDSQMEESARTLGASPLIVAQKIIFPLLRPSIISASTLVFAKCLGDVGVTYIIGAPVKLDLLATSLLRTISTGQSGMSAIIAGAIVILGATSVLIDMKLLKAAQRFVTIGSKGSLHRTTELGKWKWPAFGFASGFVFVGAVVPMAALFLTTVMRMPGIFTRENFTLDFWIGRDLLTHSLAAGNPDHARLLDGGMEHRLDGRSGLDRGRFARPVGGLHRRPLALAHSGCLSQAGYLPALSCARHRLCSGLSVHVCGPARTDPVLLWHRLHSRGCPSGKPDAVCLALWHRGDDADGQGPGGSRPHHRGRLVAPCDLHRSANSSRRTGFRDPVALHLGHQGPQSGDPAGRSRH